VAISESVRKPGTYLIIGAMCTVLVNLILIGCAWLGVHYLVGCLICLFGVGAVGYLCHSRWTFRASLSWAAYWRFVLGLTSSTCTVSVALFIGVTLMGLSVAVVSPTVTVLMTGWNYFCARWAIERKFGFRSAN
jgi:hypothetical protein